MTGAFDLAADIMGAFAGSAPAAPIAARSRLAPDAIGPAVTVTPDGGPLRDDLVTTLERRASIRFFADTPVPAGHVASVVAAGLGTASRLWPDPAEADVLETTVVATRVAGLEPGIHRLEPGPHGAAHLVPLRSQVPLSELTLQREFAGAAAIIALGADLDRATERRGAHGYRQVMSRAGAAAYAMWLEAVATGLVGTVFAGFIPASVRGVLRADGVTRCQLFAFALGHPAIPIGRPTTDPASGPPAAHRERNDDGA